MREFVIRVSEETYNTILTALRYEKFRVVEDGEDEFVGCLEDAIKEVCENSYMKN